MNRPARALASPLAAIGLVAALLASGVARAQALELDPELPAYERVSGVAGTLDAIGSDTLGGLVTQWAEAFARLYPSVRVQVEAKGSSTAPPALAAGTAQLGPMSRAMKASERDAFARVHGYEPTRVRVAVDALGVFVHRDNPLEAIDLLSLDAIFSATRACGSAFPLERWGQLGVEGRFGRGPIRAYGRNSASGTYGFFLQHALCGGDYRPRVKEQPGSGSVVYAVENDPFGIGFSSLAYRSAGVRLLDVAPAPGEPAVAAEPAAVIEGRYPLSRFLYVYVNRTPDRGLDPLVREFLLFVLSREGQDMVLKEGYLPLSAELAASEAESLR